MTKFATNLTDAARNELIDFCAKNLKGDLDAVRYADGLIDEADLSQGAHFEIRGFHTATGNPVTINFGETDLVWEEMGDE